jgi:tetratricopeptide (TPR) repeat protein
VATNALGLGDTNGAKAEFANSLTDFQRAEAGLARGSEDLAVACLKAGDAQFALADYGDALKSYQAAFNDFQGLTNVARSLSGRALYQILRAQLELRDLAGMEDSMSQLLRNFDASEETAGGLLVAGQGFSEFGDPARARALFERFELERTNSLVLPQVSFALARTYAAERSWQAAATNCESWLQSYPSNVLLRPQVEYVRAWSVAQSGDESRAFKLFSGFVTLYPTNLALTPFARWWVADHYFRSGTNFLDAEKQYELIFQQFPNDQLAGQAQLMAARCAMARSSYQQASEEYLQNLINNSNAPDYLRDKARFAYCEAARGMVSETNNRSLTDATNILRQMYHESPTNVVGALAWCETGACDLQMGAFDAATNAFAQVLAAPSATVELRCRARVGLGAVFEKAAEGQPLDAQRPLLLSALENYMDVIFTSDEVADPIWMKEAALKALPLMSLFEGDANQLIDRLERWLPQLTDTLEKKRAALGKK